MPKRSSKPQKDTQQLARAVLDAVTGHIIGGIVPDGRRASKKPRKKNPAAVALGKLGGKKGGKARAEKLTAAQRTAIAKKAAATRWSKQP